MKITNSAQYNIGPISNPPIHNSFLHQKYQNDTFEFSDAGKKCSVSFGKGFFSSFFRNTNPVQKTDSIDDKTSNTPISEFHKILSLGLKIYFDMDIPAKNLTSIMSPNEFREVISQTTTDNFIAKSKNLDGTYFIDLDYESNYSKGGKENIFDIMNNVVDFADKYYNKTGKKFIFALTDNDTLESLRHVIRIIGENPQKYKNVRFVPAVKISYAHEAPNSALNYENCNFLVYGINPFSDNLSSFMDNTIQKRKAMVINFIKKVNQLYPEFAYTVTEFAKQNNLMYERDYAVSNLYWRAREYAETKGETAMKSIRKVPENVISEAEKIISQLGEVYISDNNGNIEGPDTRIIKNSELNSTIKGVFEQYSTHIDKNGRLVSSAENLFSDLISCLNSEPHKPVIAYAAPYYLCHDFDKKEDTEKDQYPNTVKFMNEMKKKSHNMLIAFQSVVPMYGLNKDLSLDTVKKFNQYVRDNSDLHEVGGSFIQYNSSIFI